MDKGPLLGKERDQKQQIKRTEPKIESRNGNWTRHPLITIGSYGKKALFCTIVINNIDIYKRADLNCVILTFLLHDLMLLQS